MELNVPGRTAGDRGGWIRVSSRRPCPICKKLKGCLVSQDGAAVICIRVSSDHPVPRALGGYLHRLTDQPYRAVEPILVPAGHARKASPEILDRVYQALLDQVVLTPSHRRHLVESRQLTPEAVKARGYRSWGTDRRQRGEMARNVYKLFGAVALDVPGVILRSQGQDHEYLTLSGAVGIAIPVRDVDERIIGMQIRADQAEDGKYRWLSSSSRGGAGSGTPVHVARPRAAPEGTGRVWLTEGPLKADIACEQLSEVVVAIAGVHALKDLPVTLKTLKKRGQLRELVVALDSDWRTNENVRKARMLLAERIARLGIRVWLGDWPLVHKGLDDLVVAGGRPKLSPYQVRGNGPRRVEAVEEARKSPRPGPAMSLKEAREYQLSQLKKYLYEERAEEEGDLGILVRSLPGTGKSHALTKVLNSPPRRRRRRRALVFVPRHDLAGGEGREHWKVVRGRTHANEDNPVSPCSHGPLQARLNRLRIPGQMGCEQCPALELCRENRIQQAGLPFYHSQFKTEGPVVVHPVQHFAMPSVLREAEIAVLDDCDVRSLCLEDVLLSRTQLEYALLWCQKHPQHPYAQARPLLELVTQLALRVPLGTFRWEESELLGRLERGAHELLGMELGLVLELAKKAQEPDPFQGANLVHARLDVPVRFVAELVEMLSFEWERYRSREEREWEAWNCRVRLLRKSPDGEVELSLKTRRDLPLQALKGKKLVVLDASLTLGEAQKLFPGRTWLVIDPYVEMPASVEIEQHVEQAWGKVRLQDERARSHALEEIRKVVDRHPGETIALLTHKSFATEVQRRFPRLKVGHFYGQRGSNEFAECDVGIIFGTPYPNPDELLQMAQALHWDEDPILPQIVLEGQTFETGPGQPRRQVSVRSYTDARLAELLRSKCTEELLQAIYRIRPLSVQEDPSGQWPLIAEEGTRKRAKIYLFTSMPLPALRVKLVERRPAPQERGQVIELHQAALTLASRCERITEDRLARESRHSRYRARRFLLAAAPVAEIQPPRSALGAVGPPPAQPPPRVEVRQ